MIDGSYICLKSFLLQKRKKNLLDFEMEGMYVASEDQIQILQIDTEGPFVK